MVQRSIWLAILFLHFEQFNPKHSKWIIDFPPSKATNIVSWLQHTVLSWQRVHSVVRGWAATL